MLEHTLNWYKGEIFEGKGILLFGLVTLVLAVIFRFWGDTPYAKALFLPILVLGLLFAIIGGSMVCSNQKAVSRMEQHFHDDRHAFVEKEKKRVEDFQYLYPLSLGISAVCFVLAVAFLMFTKSMHLHAIAISLILLGTAFMVIDYFSKERATIYYEHLTNFIGTL